jgi:hypothetical protein
MRIAYVSLHWPRTRDSGVGKKIQNQIETWGRLGHKARLFMHASMHEPASELIEADVFPYEVGGKLRTEMNRIRAAKAMLEAMADYKPDIIYLRYGIYVYPAHRLMKVAPVVEEINTNDLIQHEGLGGLYNTYNRYTRGFILGRVDGLVTVSRELAVTPPFAYYNRPTCVISNGINLEETIPMPPPKNETPRLAFIATPEYYWHGIDKLAALASGFPDLTIDLIGYEQIAGMQKPPENLILHGFLDSISYRNILGRADAAIGTLALHRKNMEEASPLKTRECLAYGIPMVLPYVDSDVGDLDCDFLLRIPNKEDNIQTHGEAIRAFAYRMRGVRADRSILEPRIDSLRKEERRLKFFDQILTRNHGNAQ